jgi:hypothetical protein
MSESLVPTLQKGKEKLGGGIVENVSPAGL